MMRDIEVGLFTPSATRERGKALAKAYDLLWQVATDEQKAQIRPHKLAWDTYLERLLRSWQTAAFETGEVAAYEAEFGRLRRMVEEEGVDVSRVPAIRSPLSAIDPIETATKEVSRGMTVLGIGLSVIGGVLLLRLLMKGDK